MTRARKPTRNYKSRKINICSWVTELDISDSNLSHNPCNRARIESNRHTVPGPSKGVIGLLSGDLQSRHPVAASKSCSLSSDLRSGAQKFFAESPRRKKKLIVNSNLPKDTLGNSSKRLLDGRLLFFLHPLQRLCDVEKKGFLATLKSFKWF